MKTALYTEISPKLSTAGRVAAYMSIAMFAAQANANITTSGNTNTQASTKNGVAVVNIATPNTQGLSHNTYTNYNVSKQGAVLNNSKQQGNSVLAGSLAANANLTGNAAKVILNEVVSSNESLLLGKQEIFGMAADYVLANPNGINCDGCGFINIPRASLVVGKPIVDKDVLAHFLLNNDKELAVKNKVSANSIDFLAPTVTIEGDVAATKDINVIMGRSKVDYKNLQTSTLPSQTKNPLKFGNCCDKDKKDTVNMDTVLDGKVVGSMQAGRIRIHSADKRVNLYVNAKANANNSISIDMAANTKIQDSQLKAKNNLDISAENLLINGKKTTQVTAQDSKKWDVKDGKSWEWWNKVDHLKTSKSEAQTLSKSTLNAGNVNISANNEAKVIATDITANNAQLKATTLSAEADTVASSTDYELYRKSKGLWHNQTEKKKINNQLAQNNWQVANKLTVNATDTALHAVNIKANDVALTGVNRLNVYAGKVTDSNTSTNDYKNETSALKTGEHIIRKDNTKVVASHINANNISMTSHGKAQITGSHLKANSIQANGRGSLVVGTETADTLTSDIHSYKQWGGIAGGETKGNSKTTRTHTASTLKADNISLNNESGVNVLGSRLNAANSININANSGDVTIDHVKNNASQLSNDRHGTAFNITDKSNKVQNSADTTVSSALAAKSVAVTAKNVAVKGSSLTAQDKLSVTAYNKLSTDVADAQTTQVTENYTLGFKGYAKADGKKLKGKAGARLQGVKTVKGTGTGKGTANTLKAKTVAITAKEAELKGSKLNANDIQLNADKLTLAAGEVKTQSKFNNKGVTGAGIYVSGSLSKVAIGAEIGHEQTNKAQDTFKTQNTQLSVTNGVNANVANITLAGATITTPKNISLKAKNITTEAAHDRVVDTEINGFGGVSLEAYAKTAPVVGANLSLDGEGNKKVTTTKKAVASKLNAQNISLTASEKVADTGTQYTAANHVDISAKDYQGKAADNSTVSIDHYGKAGVDFDVYTDDFKSVTAEIGANGKYQYEQDGESTAVKGNINAKNINITAKDKLAVSHNMQADNIELTAKNSVAITQDNNRQWKKHAGFDVAGGVGVQYTPPNAFKPEFDIKAGVNYLKVNDTQAVVSNVKAKNLNLTADNTVGVAGSNIHTDTLAMQANNVMYDAAYDSHKASGIDLSGKLSLKLGIKKGSVSGGDAGIGGDIARVNEASTKARGGKITAKSIRMTANSDQALAVVGADINTDTLTLTNNTGDVAIKAGKGTVYKGNWGLGAHIGVGGNKKKIKKVGVGAHLDIDTDNSVYYDQGSINAKAVNLTAGKNALLQSNLKSDSLKVTTGGDFDVTSARDKTGKFLFKVGASVGYRQAFDGKKFKVKDVIKSMNKGMIFGVKAEGNLNVNIDHRKQTQVADVQVNNMVLNVGSNNVNINAAKVAAKKSTGFHTAKVTTKDNKDFVHHLGVDFNAKTPNPLQMFKDIVAGKKLESPVKAGSHFKWEDYKSATEVDVK